MAVLFFRLDLLKLSIFRQMRMGLLIGSGIDLGARGVPQKAAIDLLIEVISSAAKYYGHSPSFMPVKFSAIFIGNFPASLLNYNITLPPGCSGYFRSFL